MVLKSRDLHFAFDEVTKDFPLLYDIGVTTLPPIPFDDVTKSIIVWNVFSTVAYDYTFRDVFIPKIINLLNLKFNCEGYEFGYDDYILNRKQLAVRSGTGKISKPSLAFHKKFGLNYKIDLILTNAEFEDSVVVEDMLKYENCIGCDAPCEKQCPVGCKFNFEHSDWEKCEKFISKPEWFENPEKMCRICQDACPYSEELKENILKINPKYGSRLKL